MSNAKTALIDAIADLATRALLLEKAGEAAAAAAVTGARDTLQTRLAELEAELAPSAPEATDSQRPVGVPTTYDSFGLVTQRWHMAGMVGRRRGPNTKIHRLHVEEVVGVVEGHEHRPGSYGANWLKEQRLAAERPWHKPRRIFFSVTAACNGNGQHVGHGAGQGIALDRIDCARCKR